MGTCIYRFDNTTPSHADISKRQLVYLANHLAGQKLHVSFGYCQARLSLHDSVLSLGRCESGSDLEAELNEISQTITGHPAGNKEVYVTAECKKGRIVWMIVQFYDWEVKVTDNLEALRVSTAA